MSLPGDYHTSYFSPWNGQRADEADALAAKLDEFPAVSTGVQSAPANFEVPEGILARVECCQMVVREDSISFIAIPKHTDSYVHTAELPLQLIEAAAAA